jgi:hypothetical protein
MFKKYVLCRGLSLASIPSFVWKLGVEIFKTLIILA